MRPARPTVSVYSVYFVVQFFASFAFFAAEDFTLLNQFYSSPDSSRRASFRAGFLRVSSTAYIYLYEAFGQLVVDRIREP